MPEMELRWPEAAGFNFLWLQILGYTGWPNNDAERSARLARYFAGQLAGIGTRNDAELKAETSITQFRLERDEADRARALDLEIYRKFKESARDQCLVALEEFGWFRALHSSPANSRFPLREVATTGRVLITVRSIETYHQNKLRSGSGGASLNKAFQVVAKAAGQNKLLIKGEKEIKNVWARFRNSAHLAASFLLTSISREDDVEEIVKIVKFLLIAKDYQNFGTAFYPKGGSSLSSLLNHGELWSVPNFSAILKLLLFQNRKISAGLQETISAVGDLPTLRRAFVPTLARDDLASLRKYRAL